MRIARRSGLEQHCQDQLASLRALADELTPEQWAAPSLCTGWTVKTVYAHLLYGRVIGPVRMGIGIARHGGSMDRWGDAASRAFADTLTVEQLRAAFAQETSRWPERGIAGLETDAAKLADNTVHELDIRWALDIRGTLPEDRLAAALTASCTTGMWGNTKRVKNLQLEATDLDWTFGSGKPVQGPGHDLLLAVNVRRAGVRGLTGAASLALA